MKLWPTCLICSPCLALATAVTSIVLPFSLILPGPICTILVRIFFISIISLSYTYVFVSWGTYGSSIFWRYPHRRWRSAISIILHGHLLRSTRWLWSWSLPIRVWASGAVDRNIPKYPTHGPAMFPIYWTLASRALPPLLSSLTSDTLHLTWTFHSHPNTATFNGTTVHKNQNRNRVPRIWANVGKYLVFLLNALLDQ